MNQMYKVVYERVGDRKHDYVNIWAADIADAVNVFESTEIDDGIIPIKYTKYAIISITAME